MFTSYLQFRVSNTVLVGTNAFINVLPLARYDKSHECTVLVLHCSACNSVHYDLLLFHIRPLGGKVGGCDETPSLGIYHPSLEVALKDRPDSKTNPHLCSDSSS